MAIPHMLVLPPTQTVSQTCGLLGSQCTTANCVKKCFFPKSAAYLQSHICATKCPTDKIKYSLETLFLSPRFFIFYNFLNLNQDFRVNLQFKKLCTAADFVKNTFFSNFEVSYLCNETSDQQNKIFLRNAIPFSFFSYFITF
jgi:hypothetical protein